MHARCLRAAREKIERESIYTMPPCFVVHVAGVPSAIVSTWEQAKEATYGVPNTYAKKFSHVEAATQYIGCASSSSSASEEQQQQGRQESVEDVYTDGALRDGIAVYAVYFSQDDARNVRAQLPSSPLSPSSPSSPSSPPATVPRAELMAVLEAARRARSGATVHSDSLYAVSACNNANSVRWTANRELILATRELLASRSIRVVKVAGHTGHQGNEAAHRLCRVALEESRT